MKHLLSGCALVFLAAVSAESLGHHYSVFTAPTSDLTCIPVVVELFTSEGCSSCPPADALLARLAEQQPISAAEVIALEEHVDYWNDQGWADPFSSREWTLRQNVYAGVLGNGNPYTPQMVVDGGIEFVGSRASEAQKAILQAASKTKIPVTLEQRVPNGAGPDSLAVNVGRLGDAKSREVAEVWMAITETGLHSAVARGENAGQDLHHAAIVRSMRKIGEAKGENETSFSGSVNIPLKGEWRRENLAAVVFVQERKSRRILGAARVSLAK